MENYENANLRPGVKCEVVNCVHNEQRSYCNAKEIKVGPAFAATEADTICATFKQK